MNPVQSSVAQPFSLLRALARPRTAVEQCELCSADLSADHQHLLETAESRLLCCCDACAILFSGQQNQRYRRVPRRLKLLSDLQFSDTQWDDLRLPINLAFFFYSSPLGRVVAIYPSPAGATESLLPLEAWHQLAEANPVLRELEPDVEALLVNRIGQSRDYYLVPIDECYKLVGIVRKHWRGLGGGAGVWEEMNRFFAYLQEKLHG